MALCRCIECGKPKGRIHRYDRYARPIGFPDTSSICGRRNCTNPGVIWLDEGESDKYLSNQRIFCGPNNFAKMRADDSGIRRG
jgi:hypothetical protein